MRIAFLTYEFPDARPGGIGAYVVKSARALAAAGHEPHVFTLPLPAGVGQAAAAGVTVHEVADVAERVATGVLPPVLAASAMSGGQASYKLLVGTLLCDALSAAHRERPFDIVEAAEWEGLALPLLLRPDRDLPVVVQIHLGHAADALGNGAAGVRDPFAEGIELASIVAADGLCAATQSIVEVTRRVSRFSRPAAIIPYPVETAQQCVEVAGGESVLFVGRLQRRKGCDVLAAASNLFLRDHVNATVRFAGSDTLQGAGGSSMLVEMLAAVDGQVRDRFIYLGELSQKEVAREVDGCVFQVVPSVVENFANTAVDAMARGKMVVYGGGTGLDEVVGGSGVRVRPLTAETLAAAMGSAWNNRRLTRELGSRGREKVERDYDPAAVCRARVGFYGEVISDFSCKRGERVPEWSAVTGSQVRAILGMLTCQLASAAGLEPARPTPGMVLAAKLTALAARLGRPPRVWLFGAGRFTQKLLGERHRWESVGFSLAGVIDDHRRFAESPSWLGLSVKNSGAALATMAGENQIDAVVLSTDTLLAVFRERTRPFAERGCLVITLEDISGGSELTAKLG